MNEAILIEFERNGVASPVTGVRSTSRHRHEIGVVLDNETSAWPRGFALNLKPVGEAAKHAIDRVQQRLDWKNPTRFEVEMARRGKALRLEGVDADALPAGVYDLQFRLSGLKLRPTTVRVTIGKGKTANVTLAEKIPSQRVQLNRPLADFDDDTRRVLSDERSQLDGRPAGDWLENQPHADRRKACMLNLFARLAQAPRRSTPLSAHLEYLLFAEVDRMYCGVRPDFLEAVAASKRFKQDTGPIAGTHQRMRSRLPEVDADDFELRSFRENSATSMQLTIAVPPEDASTRTHYVDADMDFGNPGWDLRSFLVHVGELLHPSKTNHLKLRKSVLNAGASDFLYYDIVRV